MKTKFFDCDFYDAEIQTHEQGIAKLSTLPSSFTVIEVNKRKNVETIKR
jgi:hypothetical protein